MNYEIRNLYRKRREDRFVVLTQVRNMWEKETIINPNIKIGSLNYHFQYWERYFFKQLVPYWRALDSLKVNIAPHYFVEQVNNDFQVSIMLPEFSPSLFLENLVNARIIPEVYRNAILIAILEDFTLELPDKRLWEQLAYKLLVPLLKRNEPLMRRENIKYIDDIIIDPFDLEKKLNAANLRYDIKPAQFFVMSDLMMQIRKHHSNIRNV